ncbi:hypothetical protein GF389_04260 [Candidatus Dojkabacteria bacterium]|nr:hypothetical protein [Candidatus Dojkabacteria bacterium]
MQNFLRLSLGFIIFSFFLVYSAGVEASTEGLKLEVQQNILFSEENSSVKYDIRLSNESDRFVDEFVFSPGFRTLDGPQMIKKDLSDQPIAPGSSRSFTLDLVAPELVEVYGEYRRAFLTPFDTKVELLRLETKVDYPQSWQVPIYNSVENSREGGGYIFWGNNQYLDFDLKFDYESDGSGQVVYPFFVTNDRQQVAVNTYDGIAGLSFDREGNSYVVLDGSGHFSLNGTVLLSNAVRTKELSDELKETIYEIIEEKGKYYSFDQRNARYFFCAELVEELNQEEINSSMIVGIDLEKVDNGTAAVECWLNTDLNGVGYHYDPHTVLQRGGDGIWSTNSDRVEILNLEDNNSDLLTLGFPIYKIDILKKEPKMESEPTEIRLISGIDRCDDLVTIEIINDSNQVYKLLNFDDQTKGIMPHSSEEIDLDKNTLKKNDYILKYMVGNVEYEKNLFFEETSCPARFQINEAFKSIGLIAFFVFLLGMLYSRISTRPL